MALDLLTPVPAPAPAEGEACLDGLLPAEWLAQAASQRAIPAIARNPAMAGEIEARLARLATRQTIHLGDAREPGRLTPGSVHLVVTSPPYWTLKAYPERPGQLGWTADYDSFLEQLGEVWRVCFEALAPGGRLVCVVGDVCLSRRRNGGRHTVVPLHASIQEQCRRIGFDNLAPIIWHKIANAAREAKGSAGSFLGKPYEPNSIIKNDIEFILMLRKPGGYRSPSLAARLLSIIPKERHDAWFRQVWNGPGGASTRNHPAPFPLEVAERLVRMFSFAGDTVLDPFAGTATTLLAAANWGRNGVGVEIEPAYVDAAAARLAGKAQLTVHRPPGDADRHP